MKEHDATELAYKKGYAKGYEDGRRDAELKWIPVTERLPEEGDRCLCNVKSFAFPGSFYRTILRYSKVGFHDGRVYEEGVTHWMPLPEPPKED